MGVSIQADTVREEISGPSLAITYIYKCRNRKCKSFKKDVELALGPTEHVSKHSQLPLCPECHSALKFIPLRYSREVFANPMGAFDPSLSDSELSNIIQAAAQTVRAGERSRMGRGI
jgi:hypothetical protein